MSSHSSSSDNDTLPLAGLHRLSSDSEIALPSPQLYDDEDHDTHQNSVLPRLYVSHFLSTWNTRVFEFGAILYLAAIFPGTLLPMSVYAVARGASAICFSSLVGWFIDTGDRLNVARVSIVGQRISVAISCYLFFALARDEPRSEIWRYALMIAVTILACIEKLCSITNMVSIERDWVVTIAGNDQRTLTSTNSQMRRIDLVCKLLGPLLIGLVDGITTETAIIANFGMNIASVTMEYYFIAQVYNRVPALQRPKDTPVEQLGEAFQRSSMSTRIKDRVIQATSKIIQDARFYFGHQAFLPSFAGALLYLTVLSFSGQMVTFLLSSGYNSTQVSVARTVSVSVEVLATWAGPWMMGKIGPIRAGLWFASWQSVSLLSGLGIFWRFINQSNNVSATALVGGTVLSRLGLWGFDLCTQVIVQEEVELESRGSFATTESAWQNVFEMCSYLLTIVFTRPDQFPIPASISLLATVTAWALYSRFVAQRRGHLLHWPTCMESLEKRYTGLRQPLRSVDRGLVSGA